MAQLRNGLEVSFVVGKHFDTFIADQIESGRYNNASEVVRTALRMMEDYEQNRAHLKALIDEGIASIEEGNFTEYENTGDLTNDIIKMGMELSNQKD
jgi:antitoxin ParD1/3/4